MPTLFSVMAGTRFLSKSTPEPQLDPGLMRLMDTELHAQELGKYGLTAVSGSTTTTGNFAAIQPGEGGVTITAITGEGVTWVSQTLAEGNIVYGDFTSITQTSGFAILYKSK